MKEMLKTYYHFTDLQIAQLDFLRKTLLSEISKVLIMGFLFRKQLDVYCISVLALCLLRTSTGGLHCKTYLRCLVSTTCYMAICLTLLPPIVVALPFKAGILLTCAMVNYIVGPVTSDVHLPLNPEQIQKGRTYATIIILFFMTIQCIIPENIYVIPIFWIIIIHTLQLIAAKIRKKGVKRYEAEIT